MATLERVASVESGHYEKDHCIYFQVLWPYFLECLIPQHNTDAVGAISHCAGHLASKKRQEEKEGGQEYLIDYNIYGKFSQHVSY